MKRQLQLEEDTYVDGLRAVIKRDFFPELEELRDAQAYIEADRRDNFSEKRLIQERKQQRVEQAQQAPDASLASVDAFLSNYTSEDNASFVDLQTKELQERQEADVWGKRRAELQDRDRQKKMLLLEGPGKPMGLLTGAAPTLALEASEQQKKLYDNQRALALMASGDKVIDPCNTRLSAEAIRKLHTVAPPVDPTGQRKKLSAIVHRNRLLEGGKGSSFDLDDLFDRPTSEDSLTAEPTVNGCTFVATPLIVPGQTVGASPVVSWGEVEGTPVVLHRGREFSMPAEPTRDRVGQRLADQRLKRGPSNTNPSPSIRSGGTKNTPLASPVFSPAGQKLLDARRKSKGTTPLIFKSPSVAPGAKTPTAYQSPAHRPK